MPFCMFTLGGIRATFSHGVCYTCSQVDWQDRTPLLVCLVRGRCRSGMNYARDAFGCVFSKSSFGYFQSLACATSKVCYLHSFNIRTGHLKWWPLVENETCELRVKSKS
jgi:hypothetical protein